MLKQSSISHISLTFNLHSYDIKICSTFYGKSNNFQLIMELAIEKVTVI